MEKPKRLPTQPDYLPPVRDPKLPVIRGTAPHNLAHDHLNLHPIQQVEIDNTL